jgi:GGDEF domain-containing protein
VKSNRGHVYMKQPDCSVSCGLQTPSLDCVEMGSLPSFSAASMARRMLQQADAMAYRAKANGRNQYVVAAAEPGFCGSSQ